MPPLIIHPQREFLPPGGEPALAGQTVDARPHGGSVVVAVAGVGGLSVDQSIARLQAEELAERLREEQGDAAVALVGGCELVEMAQKQRVSARRACQPMVTRLREAEIVGVVGVAIGIGFQTYRSPGLVQSAGEIGREIVARCPPSGGGLQRGGGQGVDGGAFLVKLGRCGRRAGGARPATVGTDVEKRAVVNLVFQREVGKVAAVFPRRECRRFLILRARGEILLVVASAFGLVVERACGDAAGEREPLAQFLDNVAHEHVLEIAAPHIHAAEIVTAPHERKVLAPGIEHIGLRLVETLAPAAVVGGQRPHKTAVVRVLGLDVEHEVFRPVVHAGHLLQLRKHVVEFQQLHGIGGQIFQSTRDVIAHEGLAIDVHAVEHLAVERQLLALPVV